MLTADQQKLYDCYMTEVTNLQIRAIDVLEERARWVWPDRDDNWIHKGLAAGRHYTAILDCLDLQELANTIEDLQADIDDFMIEKLSKNL